MLGRMRPSEMGVLFKVRGASELQTALARKAGEHSPGRLVVVGNGGDEVCRMRRGRPINKDGEHLLSKAQAARIGVNGHLPDEDMIWF